MTPQNSERRPDQGGEHKAISGRRIKGQATADYYHELKRWVRAQHHEKKLTPTQRHVFLALLGYVRTDETPPTCFPSIAELAKETGYDKRTITRATAALAAAGVIRMDTLKGGRVIHYFFLFEPGQSAYVSETNVGTESADVGTESSEPGQKAQLTTNEPTEQLSPVESAITRTAKPVQTRVREAINHYADEESTGKPDAYKATVRSNARRDHGAALTSYARRHKGATAEEIVKAVLRQQPRQLPPITYEPIELPPAPTTAEDIERARNALKQGLTEGKAA